MSGDLQAKRKSKSRIKKKNQILELEKRERRDEASCLFAENEIDSAAADVQMKHSLTDTEANSESRLKIFTRLFVILLCVASAVSGAVCLANLNLIGLSSLKDWGTDCILPDLQGLQNHLTCEGISETWNSIKESLNIDRWHEGLVAVSHLWKEEDATLQEVEFAETEPASGYFHEGTKTDENSEYEDVEISTTVADSSNVNEEIERDSGVENDVEPSGVLDETEVESSKNSDVTVQEVKEESIVKATAYTLGQE